MSPVTVAKHFDVINDVSSRVLSGYIEHLQSQYGSPQRIQVDNSSEFISKALDLWAYENDVMLAFSDHPVRQKPVQAVRSRS